ncbi:neutral zinc metallopeptidase [Deinococcus sonorensis]|uniref:Neutral zinc metallopeptidase n=2 Tax=Deinococcus sonorensis TaxID=309891 RepID=A0AAU7UCY4_9DEIO
MDWQNLPRSSNVEDGRGGRGGLPGGGVAVGGGAALIIALLGWLFGIDTSSITGGGQTTQTQTRPSQTQPGQTQPSQTQGGQQDQTLDFVSRILGSTEQVWGGIFQKSGKTYTPPKLRLFSGAVNSACGQASSAVGPFYCPSDQRVYLDTDFFAQMDRQLGGGGDFAYSYVIAHEVGHHVQNLLGISDQVERAQRSATSEAASNRYSVMLELQADCFAGVWGNGATAAANITQQDVQEAISTATAIGDDALQEQGQGYVVPDSFTHGTSQQRVSWFMKGYKSGDPNQCDTFNGSL